MSYPQTSFVRTKIDKTSLIGRRRAAVVAQTLVYQLNTLKSTGRYDAFRLKWHPTYDEPPLVSPIPNHLFWDSDVAKWIEGACYFLREEHLPVVDAAVHELVDMIEQAQQPDGYLNIHYTVVAPGKRFTNLKDMHEMYNLGHMIEAALAHEDLYGNGKLLNVVVKYVALISKTFGPHDGQLHGYPGHPELELALLRLHARTGDAAHLALARYFLTERGNPSGANGRNFFEEEARIRGDDPAFRPAFYPEVSCLWYHQAHQPIVEQETVEGHSVRLVYLMTAYTDLVRLERDAADSARQTAIHRLWDNMVEKKMYLTGGIGAIRQWEGFGRDYFLPASLDEGGCYSETCAAIGVMMWAQRMLQIQLDGRVGDVMELCLYNSVLTSMSHDGKAFTYHNQLATSEGDLDKRCDWFTVACCPPNIMRLLGSIGGYIWTQRGDGASDDVTVDVHLFVSSTLEISGKQGKGTISQSTQWPWKDRVDFDVQGPVTPTVNIRIPGWASRHQLEPKCSDAVARNGYLTLPSTWVAQNPKFSLSIGLQPRWIAPHPLTGQETIALARGPVVYCVEDADNAWVEDHFRTTHVNPHAEIVESLAAEPLMGDEPWVKLIVKDGSRVVPSPSNDQRSPQVTHTSLQEALKGATTKSELNFVPYGFRSNRGGKGHMRVALKKLSS